MIIEKEIEVLKSFTSPKGNFSQALCREGMEADVFLVKSATPLPKGKVKVKLLTQIKFCEVVA